ncbi:hypothetical protein HBA55_10340 [Pseudomaricurvus alkylphenolicus]|jgi:hypothetical protein|uniref:replication protein P n=1 Tax=Pseudomaricurvus alkylphenolicus TaxID=1306991 RepID=UPI00142390BD|nr:replication protein P [Pseudomaricurvus alkylphenolicus]NIB39987.1 hypothetical protein [Pseudomaricurvus alkylphenolicus]
MKDSNQLLQQVTQQVAPGTDPSPKTSTTAAGPSEGQPSEGHKQRPSAPSPELIDAINQVFALFRINYHNQYHSAFGDVSTVNQAKRLWVESLQRFAPEAILRGAKKAIEDSEYLPTLHKMIGFCQGTPQMHGLPDVHSAYLEACQAPSPKAQHHWSHAAVYHAGRASDWYFLGNNPERLTFPVFRDHYQQLCQRVVEGEQLPAPEIQRLPQHSETPLTKEENAERMAELRRQLDI